MKLNLKDSTLTNNSLYRNLYNYTINQEELYTKRYFKTKTITLTRHGTAKEAFVVMTMERNNKHFSLQRSDVP